jgi:hypothetical protein
MVLGALLIVNMLIAMMGNTYLAVAETEKEWTRQVRIYTISMAFHVDDINTLKKHYPTPLL